MAKIFGRLGVAEINSNPATFIRMVVILALTGRIRSWRCFYRALTRPASKVAPIDKLGVAFTILLGAIFPGESLSWPTIIGGSLILLGSIVTSAF